ncbi:hypothetical protein SPONL_1511 [uncultured Candidatus Thioglobus sp.]|nr:hypothetical protein SPONL_1511 [uncultured Candidatus Thioglobus sp.]
MISLPLSVMTFSISNGLSLKHASKNCLAALFVTAGTAMAVA